MPLTQCSHHSAFIHTAAATLILFWDSHCSFHLPILLPWKVNHMCMFMNGMLTVFVDPQIFCKSQSLITSEMHPSHHTHIQCVLSRYMHALPVIQSADSLCYTTVSVEVLDLILIPVSTGNQVWEDHSIIYKCNRATSLSAGHSNHFH